MSINVNPVILTATNLCVSFGEQIILDNASLSIHEGDRIGLVGRNGAGKSTFLKIISDIIGPDSGEIAKKKNLEVSFLSQEFTLLESHTVYENIISGAQKFLDLIEKYEKADFDSSEREKLELTINELDAWNLEKRIDVMIKSLSAPDKNREVKTLSGEKKEELLCVEL